MKTFELLTQTTRWIQMWRCVPVFSWVSGAVAFRCGEFSKAARLYPNGIARHPYHAASTCARLDLSFCLYKQGKLDASEAELKFLTHFHPEIREGHVRLARLQLWRGHALDAAWSARHALKIHSLDSELASIFLFAALENDGPQYLIEEARAHGQRLVENGDLYRPLQIALALANTNLENDPLSSAILRDDHHAEYPVEALLTRGERALRANEDLEARRLFRRALECSSEHPRALAMLARSYLVSGPFYNSSYALQLATLACQFSAWGSPRELHVLAEATYHADDREVALMLALRAQEAGKSLFGSYQDVKILEEFIENLQTKSDANQSP